MLALDAAGGIDLGVFAQFGAVGAIAVLGIVFAKGAYARERERADRAEADNRALREQNRERERAEKAETEARRLGDLIIDRVIPALSSATAAAQESADLLATVQRERERERELSHLLKRQEGGT